MRWAAAVLAGACILGGGCKERSGPERKPSGRTATGEREASHKTIHEAAEAGDAKAVAGFLAKGMSANLRDADGWTPLHRAAERGRISVVRLLLEKGANVNAEDAGGYGPLAFAAMNGHAALAEMLIDAGAALDPPKGLTPSELAKEYKHKAVADLLRRRGAKCPPSTNLCNAIENWDTRAVRRLLDQGASLSAPDDPEAPDWSYPPLHHAAEKGFLDIVRLLVGRGADVKATHGQQQWTPLHRAVFYGHVEVAEFLLAHGAQVNARDNAGSTPLDWARSNNRAMIQLLKKYGGKSLQATNAGSGGK